MSEILHGTAVSIDGHGIVLTGKSGSGKSDLAVRLIDRGAVLIGDDQVRVTSADGLVISGNSGQLEIRGLGILNFPHCAHAPLRLLVELGEDGERFPASLPLGELAGQPVAKLRLSAFTPSAAIKVEMALKSVIDAATPAMR
jgi:HPr kinase/phosphorylase